MGGISSTALSADPGSAKSAGYLWIDVIRAHDQNRGVILIQNDTYLIPPYAIVYQSNGTVPRSALRPGTRIGVKKMSKTIPPALTEIWILPPRTPRSGGE